MRLRVLPRAAADLEAIALYVAAENSRAALALVDAIERRLQQLTRYPYSGLLREDIAPGIRHLVAGRYLAFYRATPDSIEVLRVLHGSRRVEAHESLDARLVQQHPL